MSPALIGELLVTLLSAGTLFAVPHDGRARSLDQALCLRERTFVLDRLIREQHAAHEDPLARCARGSSRAAHAREALVAGAEDRTGTRACSTATIRPSSKRGTRSV